MRVVDLADRYHLTTADALDLCTAAGIDAKGSDTELDDAQVAQWVALADEQQLWRERAGAAEPGAAPVGGGAASPPSGGERADPSADAEEQDGDDFGPIPVAPWEQDEVERAAAAHGAPNVLPTGPDLSEWGALAPGPDAPQITPFAPGALALALMSFILPFAAGLGAYALAYVAKVRIRESNGRVTGERMATIAQVISVIGIVVWLGILGVALVGDYRSEQDQDRRTDLQVDAGVLQWNELAPGQCVRIPHADLPVSEWRAVRCDAPHEAEVMSVVKVNRPAGDAYPGRRSFIPLASDECAEAFRAYVGVPYESSSLRLGAAFPNVTNWETENDRNLVCLVYEPDYAYINGTVKDARR